MIDDFSESILKLQRQMMQLNNMLTPTMEAMLTSYNESMKFIGDTVYQQLTDYNESMKFIGDSVYQQLTEIQNILSSVGTELVVSTAIQDAINMQNTLIEAAKKMEPKILTAEVPSYTFNAVADAVSQATVLFEPDVLNKEYEDTTNQVAKLVEERQKLTWIETLDIIYKIIVILSFLYNLAPPEQKPIYETTINQIQNVIVIQSVELGIDQSDLSNHHSKP